MLATQNPSYFSVILRVETSRQAVRAAVPVRHEMRAQLPAHLHIDLRGQHRAEVEETNVEIVVRLGFVALDTAVLVRGGIEEREPARAGTRCRRAPPRTDAPGRSLRCPYLRFYGDHRPMVISVPVGVVTSLR